MNVVDFLRGARTHMSNGIRHADDATLYKAPRAELDQMAAWELAWARDDFTRAADLFEEAQAPFTLVESLRDDAVIARSAAAAVANGEHVNTAELSTAMIDAQRALWGLNLPA